MAVDLLPNVPYSAVLLIGGLVCLVLSVFAGGRRETPGRRPLVVMLLGLAVWCLTYALYWLHPGGPLGWFWLTVTYVGVVIVPGAFFALALRLVRQGRALPRFVLATLLLEPIATLLLMWTDPWHGLFYAGQASLNQGRILYAGPVFWANIAYSQAIISLGTLLLVRAWWRARGIFRRQLALVASAAAIPLGSSVAFVLGVQLVPHADSTPFSFVLSAACLTYALLRSDFLDVVPVARELLIERMEDGVVVLDARGRLVDFNPSALRLLGDQTLRLGQFLPETLRTWFKEAVREAAGPETIVRRDDRFFDLRVTRLTDRGGAEAGTLVTWRDVTEFKRVQLELEKLALTDALTGLPNRRAFDRDFDAAFDVAEQRGAALGVLMIDLDGLKRVNDAEGHARGDRLLVAFAERCREALGHFGALYRIGGDEFGALIPNLAAEDRAAVLARVQHAALGVRGLGFPGAGASAGLACYPKDGRDRGTLKRLSDERMYEAKDAARTPPRS